jgi:lysophospholipase L1-like esterase
MGTWNVLRPPLAAGAIFAGQLARAFYRDLPTLENQDPSGVFGSPDAPPLTIVFLGDSSVTAPGVDPLDHSWPRQIAFHLAGHYRVAAISVAVGGAKVRDVLESQLEEALGAEPDLAYISVGSNDALRGTPTARFEADYDRIVGRLHSKVPAVGLSGIGDLGTIPRLPELARGIARIRARSIDAAIARVSKQYPRAVKSNAWDVMESMFTKESDMFGEDLFHASAQGHLAFSDVGKPVADRLVEIWQEADRSQARWQMPDYRHQIP